MESQELWKNKREHIRQYGLCHCEFCRVEIVMKCDLLVVESLMESIYNIFNKIFTFGQNSTLSNNRDLFVPRVK